MPKFYLYGYSAPGVPPELTNGQQDAFPEPGKAVLGQSSPILIPSDFTALLEQKNSPVTALMSVLMLSILIKQCKREMQI